MRKIVTALAIIASLAFSIAPVAHVAAAGNILQGVDCHKAPTSAVCQDTNNGTGAKNNPLTGSNGVIMKVANIISVIAGVAAVIIIIVGGFKFVVAGGDSNEVANARRTIIYALVGLIVIAAARFLVSLVVSKL